MPASRGYALYEEVVAKAMTARDPAAALRRAARDARLPEALRRALRRADADGIRISALIVARLRFERLLHGSIEAGVWFERDPEAFTGVFQRYHEEVPPRAFSPAAEARLFNAWQKAKSGRSRGRRSAPER